MESKSTLLQRPMGPRSINRAASPMPPTISTTAPDLAAPVSRKPVFPPRPSLALAPPVNQEPPRSVTPVLTLNIPRPSNSKPALPKINLSINASVNGGRLFDSYAGGPGGPTIVADNHPEEKTMMPPGAVTVIPPTRQPETFDSLRELVTELEAIRVGLPTSINAKTGELVSEAFSDDVFEELSRLGEGAGGAVHKVRHKPTGMIMARKTITTHEAPRKQLERELSIAASAKHLNIIQWYGAYMTPSSAEIKILLEYGEGGSLEGVGKRIKDRGARVGEKIAGRIAEGVRILHCPYILSNFIISRFYKALPTCTPKRQSIATSNHPMSSCPGKEWSSCVTLACQVNSLTRSQEHLLGPVSTWP